jgi:hypothetical protein
MGSYPAPSRPGAEWGRYDFVNSEHAFLVEAPFLRPQKTQVVLSQTFCYFSKKSFGLPSVAPLCYFSPADTPRGKYALFSQYSRFYLETKVSFTIFRLFHKIREYVHFIIAFSYGEC